MTHTHARPATDDEARALEATGAPVVLCQDETHTDEHPIRLVRTVYRADRVRLSDQYRPRSLRPPRPDLAWQASAQKRRNAPAAQW